MPTLKECMEEIRKLVREKGHEDTLDSVPLKLLFAVVEISEAVDCWKKWGWDGQYNITKICEEIIDSVFYLLDAYGILKREFQDTVDPDEMFHLKLKKNWDRGFRYGRPDSGYSFSIGDVEEYTVYQDGVPFTVRVRLHGEEAEDKQEEA